MSRKLRVHFPGAVYHVISRNRRRKYQITKPHNHLPVFSGASALGRLLMDLAKERRSLRWTHKPDHRPRGILPLSTLAIARRYLDKACSVF